MREKLARYIHDENWSGWMEWLFSVCYDGLEENNNKGNLIIPEWFVERWKRQMNTKYDNLTELEKESDRKEADRILEILNKED